MDLVDLLDLVDGVDSVGGANSMRGPLFFLLGMRKGKRGGGEMDEWSEPMEKLVEALTETPLEG